MRQLILLSIIAFLFSASACKQHDPPPPAVDSTIVYMHIHNNLDTNEVEIYGNIYETQAGRKIYTNVAQLYLSHIQLIKADGSTYDIPGRLILKTQEIETYSLGKVPVGSYKSIRFHVGLDDATNALDSSANDALNHPEMWFDSTAQPGGYKYVYFGGRIDTTTAANGTEAQMQIYNYKLGTSAAYKEVTLPDHSPVYNFEKDILQYIHLTIDYNKLFTGVQLNNSANLSITTAAANASAIGTTVNNNIPSMFSYED